jgi:hypothetical protein
MSLVSRLEDPQIRVSVGHWYPACPMTLAGYNPYSSLLGVTPEMEFSRAWDSFAQRAPRPFGLGWLPSVAVPDDVLALRRYAKEELDARAEVDFPYGLTDDKHKIEQGHSCVLADQRRAGLSRVT